MIKKVQNSWTEGVVQFRSNPSKVSSIIVAMGGKMRSETWELTQNRYKDWQLKQQFLKQNILRLNVQGFRIKRAQTPTILKQIATAEFPKLIELNLQGNNITNIEALSFIQMNSFNFITSIRPLRKTSFRQIEDINLKKNLIQEITDQLTYIQVLTLKSIQLQTFPTDKTQGQSLDWIFKLRSPLFQWLFIVSKRIKKEKIIDKFSRIYPFCIVYSEGRHN